eukprot:5885898-Pyramimonas_sp.AAC.1
MRGINLKVLDSVWADVFGHGLPFVLAGYVNVTPEVIAGGAPLFKVGAVTRASECATYVGVDGSPT